MTFQTVPNFQFGTPLVFSFQEIALKLKTSEQVVLAVYGEDDKMQAEPFTEIIIDLKSIW